MDQRRSAAIVVADGKRLDAIAYGPPPDQARTIVMLHEGLGCIALWRDFRQSWRPRRVMGCSLIRAQAMAGPIQSICPVRSIT